MKEWVYGRHACSTCKFAYDHDYRTDSFMCQLGLILHDNAETFSHKEDPKYFITPGYKNCTGWASK
jgi:hypothetical protein